MFELLSKLHPTLSKYFSSAPLNNPSSTRSNRMCSPNAISRTASGLKHRMIYLMSCGSGRSRNPTAPRSSSDSCAYGYQASKSTVNTPSHPLDPKTFYESWLVCRGSKGVHLHPSVHCITHSDASAEERSAIIQMTKRLLSSMETSAHSSAVQTVLTEIDRLHPGQSKAQISLSLRDGHLNRRATVAQASVTSALPGWRLAERIGILTPDEADLLSRARDVFGARRTKPREEWGGSRGGESVQ